MGVYKLWELLLTIAQPMAVDQLGGKVLAIDASIWIVKIDSLYSSNAEKLKSILSKIMLLKRSNILPLFVFDGVAPALKRKTLEERYRKRLVAGQLEAKKISELEIMRMVEGKEPSTRLSEKTRRAQKNEENLSQLNKTLSILSEFQEKADKEVGSELLEKIALQSQILNTKYKIMLDITPAIINYKFYITFEEYESLDLDKKMEYLQELEEYKWRHVKSQRRVNSALSEQEKLMHDLEAIQKRSIIREMQDNLFRKMMQKNVKIENGFEIVETVYNGRKVIQKRKIKEQNSNNFGLNMHKGKMKNDVASLNFKQENLSSDEPQDDFLADFCSHTISNKPKPSTATTESSLDHSRSVSNKSRNSILKKQNVHKEKKNDESDDSAVYLPFQNYQKKEHEDEPEKYVNKDELMNEGRKQQGRDELQDRDRLPAYVPNQSLLNINYSNDNLQLQSLLKVLGIPFLIAPSEAEAQCAALQQMGIVDGVVTEDSDAFLFGAKHVFRGVFQSNIRHYDYKNIQQRLRMNREKLIIFALLLGSDYTAGVKGVGLVNAMEIIKVFTTFDRLDAFKKWAKLPDVLLPDEQTTKELLKYATSSEIEFYELHQKFKNYWYLDDDFGSKRVLDAYMNPEIIEHSRIMAMKKEGAFELKPCNKAVLQKLLRQKLMLDQKQFDHFVRLLTRDFKIKRENTLHNYFNQANQMAKIRSKRLEKSLMPNNDEHKQ